MYEATLNYDDKRTESKVVKINQVCYSALAKRRYAYLGWWAGTLGSVDYAAFKNFTVIDQRTGKSVLDGAITLRQANDKFSGEDVYEMDLSALKTGIYRIQIPGLCSSEAFRVGGAGAYELYYYTTRAFFHQRCCQELGPPYTWAVKRACHTEWWESGHVVQNLNPNPNRPFDLTTVYQPKPGEKKRKVVGAWHDAADFDDETTHLVAVEGMLFAYESNPAMFKDKDLDIPESGTARPMGWRRGFQRILGPPVDGSRRNDVRHTLRHGEGIRTDPRECQTGSVEKSGTARGRPAETAGQSLTNRSTRWPVTNGPPCAACLRK